MKIDKNILITGGAGFIGSNITEFLLNNNVKFIRIFDNLSTGKKDNIQFLLDKFPNLEFMYGSIINLEDCRKAMKDIDIVCHQAALGSVPRSVKDPLSSHQNNVNGFFNILLAAKEQNIKRIVYASSSSVYGDNPNLPKVEENMKMYYHHMQQQNLLMKLQVFLLNVIIWKLLDYVILIFWTKTRSKWCLCR